LLLRISYRFKSESPCVEVSHPARKSPTAVRIEAKNRQRALPQLGGWTTGPRRKNVDFNTSYEGDVTAYHAFYFFECLVHQVLLKEI
jgi:hypothetical protein